MQSTENLLKAQAEKLRQCKQQLKVQAALYSMLNLISHVLIRAISEPILFNDVCKTILTHTSFNSVSISVFNKPKQQFELSVIEGDEINSQSGVTFPLTQFCDILGSIALFTREADYFTPDVCALLNTMAQDISFTLEALRLEQYRQQAETVLLEKEENLSVTIDAISDGVIVTDAQGAVIRMNPVAQTLTGWKFKHADGDLFSSVFNIIDTQSRQKIVCLAEKILQQQTGIEVIEHTTLVAKQLNEHQITGSIAPIYDKNKVLTGAVLVFQDVTEQYATINALKMSEQRFRDVIEASNAYIWELNKEGKYTYLTDKVTLTKGYKPEALIGHSPFEFIAPEEVTLLSKQVNAEIKKQGKFELVLQNITPTGETLWEELKGQVILDENKEFIGLRGVGVSINQRKKNEAEIKRLAYYDPLTSLPNRRMLIDGVTKELAIARKNNTFGALLFLDLDHFKTLNDSLGHAVGDELLVQIAERLTQQLRPQDLAARIGGDEFIVLLPNLSEVFEMAVQHADEIIKQISAILQEPYKLKNHSHFSSSSIGATIFPQENQTATVILKQADTALYRAKDMGRNTFRFYHPNMQIKARNRLEMEKNLRIALQKNQFQLYYQPQLNHQGELIGAEALLRWFLPDSGLIPPVKFIPIAEESGIMLEIGLWIFNQCFREVKKWIDQGLLQAHQHISINVSPKQFKQANFVQQLIDIVSETQINPSNFILEVTEGIFLTNIDNTIEKMLHLRGLGFTFSIDDFGTGYSSLSYLKRLPLNELKIDKAFIDDIIEDIDDQIIVKTIIAMAKHLQFSVIAEGVETKAQLEFLKTNDCKHYQGYFFSKPLNHVDFEDYMRTHIVL